MRELRTINTGHVWNKSCCYRISLFPKRNALIIRIGKCVSLPESKTPGGGVKGLGPSVSVTELGSVYICL